MNLIVPIVGVELGPNWANDLNADLTVLDQHNHSAGSGLQINPSGLNINTDLTFNSNNAISLRSARFTPQGSALSGAQDLGCIYETGVDLYYNDGNGNQIRITQSGSVAGSTGTITGLPSGTAGAAYQSASGTFQFEQATSTAANLDVATVVIRYPGSYPTPTGNFIALQAPTSLASGYALTLPSLPAQQNVMVLGTSGIISSVTWNTVADNRTRSTGSSTEGVGGIPVSSSSANYSTTSLTLTNIPALAIQLTTSGRPIYLRLAGDGTTSQADITVSPSGNQMLLQIVNSTQGTVVEQFLLGTSSGGFLTIPPTAFNAIDFQPVGTYIYIINVRNTSGGGTIAVQNTVLQAFEL